MPTRSKNSGLDRHHFADEEAYLQGRITFYFDVVYALSWLLYVPIYAFGFHSWPAALLCFFGGFCTASYGAYVIWSRHDTRQGGIWANLGGCLTLLSVASVTGGMYSPILGWIFFGTVTTFLCHGRAIGILIVGISWIGILTIDFLQLSGALRSYSFAFDLESRTYKYFILLAHSTITPALGIATSIFDYLIRNAYVLAQSSRQIADDSLQQLRFVFKSLNYGILTIEADGRIGAEYSQALDSIIERTRLGGCEAVPTVFQAAKLSADGYQKLLSAVHACIGEPAIAFEMNADCFPRELEFGLATRSKIIEMDWVPMIDSQGMVAKVLLSLKDVTDQRAIAAKANTLSYNYQLLATLASLNKDHFFSVYKSGLRNIIDSRRILTEHPLDERSLKTVLMNVHTIKGECRSLELRNIVEAAHDLETVCHLSLSASGKSEPDSGKLLEGLSHMESLLQEYYEVARQYLRWDEGDPYIELVKSDLVALLEKGDDHPVNSDQLVAYLNARLFITFDAFARDLQSVAQRLARDLGKAEPVLQCSTPPLYLRESGLILLQRMFIHILRNAMDHGIETPAIRIAHGKRPEGLLRLSASVIDDHVELRFSDDGQGLALASIRATASQRGYATDRMSSMELAQLIFLDGLSTATKISEISGRGVGMSAVKAYADEAGVILDLNVTVEGYDAGFLNFEIIMRLPPHHFIVP